MHVFTGIGDILQSRPFIEFALQKRRIVTAQKLVISWFLVNSFSASASGIDVAFSIFPAGFYAGNNSCPASTTKQGGKALSVFPSQRTQSILQAHTCYGALVLGVCNLLFNGYPNVSFIKGVSCKYLNVFAFLRSIERSILCI